MGHSRKRIGYWRSVGTAGLSPRSTFVRATVAASSWVMAVTSVSLRPMKIRASKSVAVQPLLLRTSASWRGAPGRWRRTLSGASSVEYGV